MSLLLLSELLDETVKSFSLVIMIRTVMSMQISHCHRGAVTGGKHPFLGAPMRYIGVKCD